MRAGFAALGKLAAGSPNSLLTSTRSAGSGDRPAPAAADRGVDAAARLRNGKRVGVDQLERAATLSCPPALSEEHWPP